MALLALVGSAALVWMAGCSRYKDPWEGDLASPKVVVTIPPLASFARAVLGKHGAVKCMCTTTGPHHYESDSRDARLLQKASIVFAVGLKLDDHFTDAVVALARRKDLPYVKLGDKLGPKLLLKSDDDDDDHKADHKPDHKHDAHHDHGEYDPHVWLGIPQAVAMVDMIRDQLVEIDEDHADDYKKNAEEYITTLKKLREEGRKSLKGKKNPDIISFHEALRYFADTFGLHIAEVIETGAGDEPSSGHLKKVVDLCKKDPKIGAITVEPQYPKTSSATLVQKELKNKGIDIPLVEVDPLETADPDELNKEGATWYVARMRKNLDALTKALK
jgi:zinc transport system substrate-binding protein